MIFHPKGSSWMLELKYFVGNNNRSGFIGFFGCIGLFSVYVVN